MSDDVSFRLQAAGGSLAAVDLLRGLDAQVSRDRVQYFLSRIPDEAQSLRDRLQNVAWLSVTPSSSGRWMEVRFKRRNVAGQAESTTWTVSGQLISADALAFSTALQFQPRWVSNTADRTGNGISIDVAAEGWTTLSSDLQLVAREAAISAGLQDYAPRLPGS